MKERRQYERFTIPLPVRLEAIELGRKKVLDLVADGLYLVQNRSLGLVLSEHYS